ncbi:MAG TPA: exonuclease SbcCD subunit D [Anaerolineales bacterium]|nr:exonuclease SbcCD subunit D [Anaerolineales bacterium]HMV95959.1 exonuclease SbcCD subunit D [Anaerolineales bacterium]HMX19162.1 exonuclease SbcCD subunit D [Anaerolineales bacterium]HMX76050.1 exonuclease SbcCD subunit D [Anaerolineales bacterium]HMZ42952.1 exonuclease SbcCD subunit D [Anaerolineales bacterium]
MRVLHFADAHIDMANYGRHDPQTGLPMRVLDFLKSLDTIVDTAISQKVDLVIFAGDAYKDRSPAPTFQREWGRRIMRLSQAQIPTLLLIGNHDISPAVGRAHALQEFKTLQVPFVKVLDQPSFLKPEDLWELPMQVIAMPWVTRSGLMANLEMSGTETEQIYSNIEERIASLVDGWIEEANENLPIIFTAHASIEGAKFGGERLVMLGNDLVLSGSLVKNQRFNYVAMGHIHKPQDVNEGHQPPVIYPGSIERVDFGEAKEDRFFVIAEIESGKETQVEWVQLTGARKFIDRRTVLRSNENVTEALKDALPSLKEMSEAIVRLSVEYPREWDTLIDETALRKYTEDAFEFHLVKRPQSEARVRIPEGQVVSSLSPLDLLAQYFDAAKVKDADELNKLAQEIISEDTLEN